MSSLLKLCQHASQQTLLYVRHGLDELLAEVLASLLAAACLGVGNSLHVMPHVLLHETVRVIVVRAVEFLPAQRLDMARILE